MTVDEALAWADAQDPDDVNRVWDRDNALALRALAADVRRLRAAVDRAVSWSMLAARPNKGYGWNTVLANLVAALEGR